MAWSRSGAQPLVNADPVPDVAGPSASAIAPTVNDSRFAVIARSTLPEEIANRLLTKIKERELRPGDKLPAERDLARMMDVSRPVVREALRALALMKVVDIRPGDGTYITSLEPKQLISHLDVVLSTDGVALVQLFEARRVIEAGNVRFAASRATDDELAGIDRLLTDMAGAVDDPDRFRDLDIDFHLAICAAAHNFLLFQFMTVVSTLGRVSRERTGVRRPVREAALRDHRRLVAGLRARDADESERAMLDHLAHVEDELRAAIGTGGDPTRPARTGRP
jgi:GntR family transcriptional regulator, transcriptional repressor for pyruvate dehydrogenase complex